MTIRQFLETNKHLDREELIQACVDELGVARRSVTDKIADYKPASSNGHGGTRVPKGSKDERVLAFREQFDKSYIIPEKVRKIIETWLQEVKWATDADMQKRCQIGGAADWKTYARENSEFEKYLIDTGRKIIWACSEELRDELQAMVYSR